MTHSKIGAGVLLVALAAVEQTAQAIGLSFDHLISLLLAALLGLTAWLFQSGWQEMRKRIEKMERLTERADTERREIRERIDRLIWICPMTASDPKAQAEHLREHLRRLEKGTKP